MILGNTGKHISPFFGGVTAFDDSKSSKFSSSSRCKFIDKKSSSREIDCSSCEILRPPGREGVILLVFGSILGVREVNLSKLGASDLAFSLRGIAVNFSFSVSFLSWVFVSFFDLFSTATEVFSEFLLPGNLMGKSLLKFSWKYGG